MKRAYGFTIVELLIVIVVIAILAAISVAAYTNITGRANNSAVKNDLSTAAKLISLDLVETGSLPAANSIVWWTSRGFSPAKSSYSDGYTTSNGGHNMLYCRSTNSNNFAIIAWTKSGNGYAFMNGSLQDFEDTPYTSLNACPDAGVGSAAAYWMYRQGAWHF